jgi:Bardet-Biedl syndrome 4 protein
MQKVRLLDNKPSEWLAHRFCVLGQFDMCLNIVDQILRRSPDNAEALALKGSVLRTKGQIDDALTCFQQAYNLDCENIRHLLEIAKCLFFLGRYPQSLKMVESLAQGESGNIWEVHHLIGQNQARLRKLKEAAESFETAMDTDIRLETVLELLSVYEQQQDAVAVDNLVAEASKYHSENPAFRRRIGRIHVRNGKLKEARAGFKVAYSRDRRDAISMLYSGAIEQEKQKIPNALRLYRRCYPSVSSSAALWNNLGLCIQVRSRREAVVACCKRAVFYAPFETISLTNMGLLFLEMGMYCSAAIVLNQARNLDRSSHVAAQGLGIALMNLEEYESAIALFQGELEKGESHDLLVNLAICLWRAGRVQQSTEVFKRFLVMVREEPTLESAYPVSNVLEPMFFGGSPSVEVEEADEVIVEDVDVMGNESESSVDLMDVETAEEAE